MATAYVTIGIVMAGNVFDGAAAKSEAVTTSGTTTATTITAGNSEYAQIFCATGVYARSGTTVTTANGIFCPPGIPTFVRCNQLRPISLIDA